MNKLDKKDKVILKALEKDGRALIKDISKKTGIPRDSVNYRIRKMKNEGVIKNFIPVCDTMKMNYPVYSFVSLKLQLYDDKIEKKFQKFLKDEKNVVYIAKVTGPYNYMIRASVRSIEELDLFIRKMMVKFPGLIKDYETSMMVDEIQHDTFYKLIGNK